MLSSKSSGLPLSDVFVAHEYLQNAETRWAGLNMLTFRIESCQNDYKWKNFDFLAYGSCMEPEPLASNENIVAKVYCRVRHLAVKAQKSQP